MYIVHVYLNISIGQKHCEQKMET